MKVTGMLGPAAGVIFYVLATLSAQAADKLIDTKSGCKIEPIFNDEGLTVLWSGGCDSEGLASGEGTLSWMVNGTLAVKDTGTFEYGMLEGTGMRQFFLGTPAIYKGEFFVGEYDGRGHFENAEGIVYDGEFVVGEMHGQGRLQFKNGNVYEGAMEGGLKSGHGKMTWSNGDTFEGNFVDDTPQGDGICHAADTGKTAACIFVDGQMAGWK
jgi:hypothetical protein